MAWRWSVCGTAEVVWKPRFLWQWPSGHLHCWVWCLSSSSWQYPIDSLWGSGQASLLANQAQQHHGHWTSFWYLWQCGQVPSPAGKWNQHLHKACQQKEAWSALKFPGKWLCWLWTSENTVDQHQQMTWQPKSSLTVETSHWTSSNMDSVPLHSSSRLWDLDFQIKCKIYFHLKRGLWTTEQQSSSFSPQPRWDASDIVSGSEVAW